MKLCVISDTHISDRYEELPPVLIKQLKDADMIIHAGDFTSLAFYEYLKSLNKLTAVLGNIDAAELSQHLNQKETFSVEKFKIGLVHGFGVADQILDNIRKQFDASYDLVIYGHSHAAAHDKIGKTIFFNPGSPTDKIFAPVNTYGLIEISKNIQIKTVRL